MKKTIYIGGAVIIGIVLGLYLLGLQNSKTVNENTSDLQTPITEVNYSCTEGNTKIDQLHNIYRCVDGEWVYVGSELDGNKG